MMKLKETKTQLKYQQVQQKLTRLVHQLNAGDKIPSERQLAADMGCSFLTVRKAMGVMVEDGLIVRRPGSGSFVANTADQQTALRFGLLISPSSDRYALRIIEELSLRSDEHKYFLSSRLTGNFQDAALAESQHMQKEGCKAIIIPWFPAEDTAAVASFTHQCPLPVCLPEYIPGLERNFFESPELFGVNLVKGIQNICHYFHLQGYTNIAYLGPNTPDSGLLQKNLSGYNNYICSNNLENLCALVSHSASAMDTQATAWQQHRGNLAIVCYDDDHALRMITAMHKIGLNAPDDFVISGYGNDRTCNLSDPPLSSVYQDFSYTAEWMLRNAKALAQDSCDQSQHLPRLRFMLRKSCGGTKHWDQLQVMEKLTECGFIVETD